jgi:putative protease
MNLMQKQTSEYIPFTPELLAPAGSLDKLKVAISYGADAVYLAGLKFGLRSAADNFTYEELKEGVEFAHSRKKAVYVVLNGFLHDKDLELLPPFVDFLDRLKVNAVIVSDIGVMEIVKKHSSIDIHVSTQASCVNDESAKLWKRYGATRVVVGREVSVAEAGKIKKEAQIEVEMFVHGSMCMAYSGNCTISNFTQGRDSNRGGCAHSCRFEYSIDFKNDEEKKRAFFMSSKDLNGIKVLPDYIKHEIDSIKVEGRMKSHLYAGTISKVYSQALDYYKKNQSLLSDDLEDWAKELQKVTHRSYAPVNLVDKAGRDTIFNERETTKEGEYIMVGTVVESVKDSHIVVQVRNAFNIGDKLEILPFEGDVINITMDKIENLVGESIERTKPSTLVKMPYSNGVEENNILRKKING